jgi:ferrous iron transport protein B
VSDTTRTRVAVGEDTQHRHEPSAPPSEHGSGAHQHGSGGASCHEEGGAAAPVGSAVVALAGAPNVGKSTLFNTLTGARRTVGNWPGTTVEVGNGSWTISDGGHQHVVALVDLPGAYSLDPMSPDEELTRDVVLGELGTERPAAVVVAASAVNLARSLYLVAQIRETDLPVVLALTMSDVAARRGIRIDPDALGAALGCSVVALDPRRRRGHEALTVAVSSALAGGPVTPRRTDLRAHDTDPDLDPDGELARGDERFACIERAVDAATHHTGETRRTHSDRIDRWVTAPVAGPLIFLAVMWVLFQITTRVAAPLQDGLGAFVNGPVSSLFTGLISAVGLGDTWVQGLVVDGLVAGVGMLLTFVPLMALMFLLLALLEDSGYLARAAVVTDRLMGRLGLPGRAFLPLVVGFGCNVPAISATRILPQARHRILTALLVPFTSCSARLTVYMLLATTFFPHNAGSVVFAMYVVSILLVVLVGLLLRGTLWRTMGAEPLVIDLPPYQRPTVRLTTSVMWLRLRGFLRTASGIIVATVVVVWLLQSTPVTGGASFGQVPVADSLYAAVARLVAPLLSPAGFGQWEAVSALVVGFVAKEAVISSWAQTYALAEPASSRSPGALGDHLHQTFTAASGGHTGVAVMAFMVFLLAYTPCVATLAAQRRELGTRWTAFGVVMQLVVAWLLAVLTFQVGSLLW